jgi:hypothetical protein
MALLASYAESFPLRRRSVLIQPALATYILARTEGTIGEITTLLTRTALVAIDPGEEALNRKTLLLADYTSPSERRRTFERAFTGQRGVCTWATCESRKRMLSL